MSTVSSPLTLSSACNNTYARRSNERWCLSSYLRATSQRQCTGLLQAHGWGCSHYPWSYALDPAAGAWVWSDATHALKTGTQSTLGRVALTCRATCMHFRRLSSQVVAFTMIFFSLVFCPPRSPMISASETQAALNLSSTIQLHSSHFKDKCSCMLKETVLSLSKKKKIGLQWKSHTSLEQHVNEGMIF